MQSIPVRIRKYVGSAGGHNRERPRPEPTVLPPERTPGIRTPFEDPYAEMRRVLAITMLLG